MTEPAREEATIHVCDGVAEWCPACHKTTLRRHAVYGLVAFGPHRVGEIAVCHDCGHSPYATPEDPR